LSVAAFYSNHGRTKEAKAFTRANWRSPSLTSAERLATLQQLTGFLSAHVSKTEALAVQEQIVEFRKTQP